MSATISISQDDITTAIKSFLSQIVDVGDIVLGQENRVSMLKDNFICITPIYSEVYSIPYSSFTQTQETIMQLKSLTIQCDVYGLHAAENAKIIAQIFSCARGYDLLKALNENIAPISASPPKQLSVINGQNQYENRWMTELNLQVHEDVVFNAETFTTTHFTLYEADQ